ncbi:hypothetical protein [Mycobacterium riyadhense]|uniref:hypothetical protein n=1 Tax=Mycobacterium riyadhense TaxID=486698 RepID=UPI00195098AC|nr:hypothetical protein [Mycobacterium riyadhense]
MTGNDGFDPGRIVETLGRHHVDYVLVGGYAAQLYGARRPTYDIDIAPSTALDNLQRLSRALRELGAGIRVDCLAEGLAFLRSHQPDFRTAMTGYCRAQNHTVLSMSRSG